MYKYFAQSREYWQQKQQAFQLQLEGTTIQPNNRCIAKDSSIVEYSDKPQQLGFKDILIAAAVIGGIYYVTKMDLKKGAKQLRNNINTLKEWINEGPQKIQKTMEQGTKGEGTQGQKKINDQKQDD